MEIRAIKTGCDNRNNQLIFKIRLKCCTEDNIGIWRDGACDDFSSFLDLAHAHVVATGHIEQDTLCAIN
ncbi:hypothetical protein D3C72_2412160 [compost metagenome]